MSAKSSARVSAREKKLERRSEEVERLNIEARERLIFFIHVQVVSGRTRYIYLEDRYGISARRWKNVCNRVQLPSLNMLVSIAKHYPFIAEWLLTGKASTQSQYDPTTQNGLDETEYGRIDLSEADWEEKLDKIQEAIYHAIK